MGQAESVAAVSPPNDLPPSPNPSASPVSGSSSGPPSMESLIAGMIHVQEIESSGAKRVKDYCNNRNSLVCSMACFVKGLYSSFTAWFIHGYRTYDTLQGYKQLTVWLTVEKGWLLKKKDSWKWVSYGTRSCHSNCKGEQRKDRIRRTLIGKFLQRHTQKFDIGTWLIDLCLRMEAAPGMLPDTFSGGIGREASSLEGELWCDPKRSKRWPKLPTSGERSSGVRNHWKCTCSEGNGLSSRTSGARPKKTPAGMPRTQFSRPGVGKRARWRENCGATQNGPKDGRSFQRVANARPVSETTGNALAAKETG
ncbi:mitochondrial intermembrane space import and assembly protein 40 [Cucumis melo var. makuwa]|uniref:Mitochondrial intermembrane space import and assembly protein 40 n=1 Tax=Cucumis melo var. makuwa TaxID=1194695 RepID=A0A5A7VGB1_CUCMM|nr:mitochondrial intermembrane space import and assembly protein 40 [Cucumis melo var. makuwa]